MLSGFHRKNLWALNSWSSWHFTLKELQWIKQKEEPDQRQPAVRSPVARKQAPLFLKNCICMTLLECSSRKANRASIRIFDVIWCYHNRWQEITVRENSHKAASPTLRSGNQAPLPVELPFMGFSAHKQFKAILQVPISTPLGSQNIPLMDLEEKSKGHARKKKYSFNLL